ncbi:MAG: GAF domain-containing protein, partial [Anaerolineales bacterium]|nr:GAF domain-containing protein [Anaerolineales bacterium]
VRAGFAADACTISLFGETARETADFRLSVGFSPEFHQEAHRRPQGLTARVRVSKEPIVASGEELNPRVRAEGIQTNVVLPLPGEKENIGALFVGYRQPRQFSAPERNLMSLFANQAALALRRARLFQQAEQRLAELQAINQISAALRAARSLDEMLPILLDRTLAVMNAERGIISLFDPASGMLHRAAIRGPEADAPPIPLHPSEGIIGYVFSIGQAYIAHDVSTDPLTRAASRPRIVPGWGGVCVPLRTETEIIGTLFVFVPLPRVISADEVHLLTTLAEIAGNAIQRARLHDQTGQQVQRLTALRTIDQTISSSLDLRVTLDVVLSQVVAQLGVDAAAVMSLNPHSQTLEHLASRGFRSPHVDKMTFHVGEGLEGKAITERRTWLTSHLPEESVALARAQSLQADQFVTYCGTPLIAKGKVAGVLEIFHRAALTPTAEWIEFFEMLAGQIAIAMDNAELFDTLQRSHSELVMAYDTTIEGWSHALDLRDKETEGHTQRVTELTLRLAGAMDIPETQWASIQRGALLHDIGKMGIPDKILLKPGPLTEEEWRVMRQHPNYARDLLSPIAYLRPALEIPYSHHEKWDGTGYPNGWQGEQIPLAARIFAVVDVWDAVLSNRPYRPAWTEERAREHIRAQSGTHFDPRVVEIFLEMLGRG